MAYEIVWSPKSKDGLKELKPDVIARIITKVQELELAPHHFIEKLTGINCWKLRVGDYRILLDIDEQKKEIQILKVGHRKNVYK